MMYKVCGDEGCFDVRLGGGHPGGRSTDGVNVINFSISGGANPYSDAVELAFLDAYNAGVFVAASAGNAGPAPTRPTIAARGSRRSRRARRTAPS